MAGSTESPLYAKLGASSSKEGLHRALADSGAAEPGGFFAQLQEDVCGDSRYYSLLHADAAGTKGAAAYLAFRESGDPSWMAGLAQDALVMNLDDIACVGAFEGILLSNTIGRNLRLIPDSAIAAIIGRYRELCAQFERQGIRIRMAGGETEDVGDILRTLSVSCTLFARVRRDAAISTDNIRPGDLIIGLASSGKCSYESEPNSGIGCNGITAARHGLIHNSYLAQYPELLDPGVDRKIAYQGRYKLFEEPPALKMSVAKALLSPTRSYAPVILKLMKVLGDKLHGAIHCSGGGQTKIIRFGKGLRYVKDNLFTPPPVFTLIQEALSIPWNEMYSVFNMGHRMEVLVPPAGAADVIAAAGEFEIEARQIGYVEPSPSGNSVLLRTAYGEFNY